MSTSLTHHHKNTFKRQKKHLPSHRNTLSQKAAVRCGVESEAQMKLDVYQRGLRDMLRLELALGDKSTTTIFEG
jgi:hypothetical protein